MAKNKLVKMGDELESVRDYIETKKAELKELELAEEVLYKGLLESMDKQGIEAIRISSGLTFIKIKGRVSFSFKKGHENEGIKWAIENYPAILSVSAPKLSKVVQPMLDTELPEFVERKQGEAYLSVRQNEE